jgi:hypothetical protein
MIHGFQNVLFLYSIMGIYLEKTTLKNEIIFNNRLAIET